MLALGCGHASRAPAGRRPPPNGPSARASGSDASATAAQLSEETHALLRAEGDLLWTRWTTGSGSLPASALAEHPRLLQRESIDTVSAAAARSSGSDAVALGLLSQQLATLAVSREAGAEIDSLERARSQRAFPAPGETRATLGERDLDRLLRDEPKAQKRAALAQAEAKVAQTLAPLAIARDAAVDKAIAALGLQSWAAVQERAYGIPLADLARLAEPTLDATERGGAPVRVARRAPRMVARHDAAAGRAARRHGAHRSDAPAARCAARGGVGPVRDPAPRGPGHARGAGGALSRPAPARALRRALR